MCLSFRRRNVLQLLLRIDPKVSRTRINLDGDICVMEIRSDCTHDENDRRPTSPSESDVGTILQVSVRWCIKWYGAKKRLTKTFPTFAIVGWVESKDDEVDAEL